MPTETWAASWFVLLNLYCEQEPLECSSSDHDLSHILKETCSLINGANRLTQEMLKPPLIERETHSNFSLEDADLLNTSVQWIDIYNSTCLSLYFVYYFLIIQDSLQNSNLKCISVCVCMYMGVCCFGKVTFSKIIFGP